jgi:hypothetical protein
LLSTKLNHNYSISSKFNYVPSSTKFTIRQGNTALPNLPFPPTPPAPPPQTIKPNKRREKGQFILKKQNNKN